MKDGGTQETSVARNLAFYGLEGERMVSVSAKMPVIDG